MPDTKKYYTNEELICMTTYQLRDICVEEKIVNGLISSFDKDEYIHQILRFRGRNEQLFITKYNQNGQDRLENLLSSARIHFQAKQLKGCAKVVCYEEISTEIFDNFTIGYDKDLADTNAILVSGNKICGIFNIREQAQNKEFLYITKAKEMKCTESNIRDYRLYCMDRAGSDLLYSIYTEDTAVLPQNLKFTLVEILNFEVRKLIESNMPLAIDFGTSNTTAGMYLDDRYFEEIAGNPTIELLKQNDVNYLYHLNIEGEIVPTLPTVIGVTDIAKDHIKYVYGYDANRLFNMSHIDDGFSVFYDIKRFVSDSEKEEEVVDRNGRRTFIHRKELVKTYLEYIIDTAKQRFKCNITHLHISSPVKQKLKFHKFFHQILPNYIFEESTMLDEGVSVLYNSIDHLMKQGNFEQGSEYKALIIDCGGGTTDLSSCTFAIKSNRVSYKVDIKTFYENGDTDFGGNNLTYRIMQLIKISLAYAYSDKEFKSLDEIMSGFDLDIFRAVDREDDTDKIYQVLDAEYEKAEEVIPTRFKDYEHKTRADYYAVKNNFYYLFDMAEKVKTEFYKKSGTLRIALSTRDLKEIATTLIKVNRWKLYVKLNDLITVQKDIPTIYLSIYQLNSLLKADIYHIIKKFIGSLYQNGSLHEFSILRLTGQSCKIDIFREALKEFIPGKLIGSTGARLDGDHRFELKLICLNGAIKYLKDTKFGFVDVSIESEKASFPYVITAFTHEGKEKVLIDGQKRKQVYGYISRNMADVTMKLFLKDANGDIRYTYNLYKNPKEFLKIDSGELYKKYDRQIVQDDLDDIEEREMKFFVLPREQEWGFSVIPVYRLEKELYAGNEEFFSFETEGWLTNFFDGTR